MLVPRHPSGVARGERWIALFGERVFDLVGIERCRQPFGFADLSHSDVDAELPG
jgi:hypothetical protein